MHLKKIKLAGFKSFVDPTQVLFPSNLTGIVGPNGCGKSNVIDAVRWVMGEMSAKNLRGDSMVDVIFNGSSTRKPVGKASIELFFDNSDGVLQGQFAHYNEIHINRQVTRDGQSQYFLNNTRCRRKDITDIFLGTGLGPRSYAIIEQGTISRLIEAKPEDLRIFLEEVAGISKYKERRRETENRIRHTRDNLDRVSDLVDEVSKHLRHLEKQAKTAEKYQLFRQDERLLQAQYDALRWQQLDVQVKIEHETVQEQETRLQEANAQKFHDEAEAEKQRQEHIAANDAFNQMQGEYYRVGAEIARVEQAIAHDREKRQRLQQDLADLQAQSEHTQSEIESDQDKAEDLRHALAELEGRLSEAKQSQEEANQTLAQWEQRMQDWQLEWEQFNQDAAQPSQTAQVERTRIQQLDENLLSLHNRGERLQTESRELNIVSLENDLLQMRDAYQAAEQIMQQSLVQREQNQATLGQVREQIKAVGDRLTEDRTHAESLAGRLASLEALQQAALKLDHEQVNDWLHGQLQQHAPRLAQVLEVEAGWEQAVECVLGQYLEAVCVQDMQALVPELEGLDAALTLFQSLDTRIDFPPPELLLSKIKTKYDLRQVMASVYVADDIPAALEKFRQLSSGSVVTRSGIWLGPGWVRVVSQEEVGKGVLVRERQIKDVQSELQPLRERIQSSDSELSQLHEDLAEREQVDRAQQDVLESQRRASSQQQAKISAQQASLQYAVQRKDKLNLEMTEYHEHAAESEREIKAAHERLNDAVSIMAEHALRRDELTSRRELLGESLLQSRNISKQTSDASHALALRNESIKAGIESNEQALQRLLNLREQCHNRICELQESEKKSESPEHELNEQLAEWLQQRIDVEANLGAKRSAVEALEQCLRELSQQIHQSDQRAMDIRDELDRQRLHWQEINVRRQTVLELLQESGANLDDIVQQMPEHATVEQWKSDLEQLQARIQRLGAINLAAIDEFAQESERKVFLDAQIADLEEALQTLERAIKKIDKETRDLFQETFDQVNVGLSDLFPRLFGGGSACLEIIGEDFLNCGVTVMARPPGKRNSTIHLLSGGEKALTAIALVFSLFNLNPAPFCMLDEVDAPLDDANVGRFCAMVKEMSKRVQFILITHNKVTMELAHQLTGVTMHEPGVSRMVAVDVDKAVELVAV